MRNLKKILALVLALMMVLSVMVTASAADFADADKIEYKEAADLMAALGVVQGTGAGYEPDTTMTREVAAMLLARIALGAENAAKLDADTTPFKDVAKNWATGAINWAAEQKIMQGDGTNFYPKKELTGYEWLKMLVATLGIEVEYTSANWKLQFLAAAGEADITDGITVKGFDYNKPIARDEAFQLALATLRATPGAAKEYHMFIGGGVDPVGTHEIDVEDQLVGIYASEVEATKEAALLNALTFDPSTDTTKYYVCDGCDDDTTSLLAQHGVTPNDNYRDKYGVPGVKYDNSITNMPVSITLDEPMNSWTNEAVTRGAIYALLGGSATKSVAVDIYQDGNKTGSNVSIATILDTTVEGGKSTNVALYKVDESRTAVKAVLVVTHEFYGEVGTVHAKNPDVTGDFDYAEIDNITYYGTGLKQKDKVLYTVANAMDKYGNRITGMYEVQTVAVPKTVTGDPTFIDGTANTVTFAGQTYSYNAKFEGTKFTTVPSAAVAKGDKVIYLDSFGNIVTRTGVDAAALNFGVVLQTAIVPVPAAAFTQGRTEFYAKLLKADGTVDTILYYTDVYNSSNQAVNSIVGEFNAGVTGPDKGLLVSYTVNANGDYDLTAYYADDTQESSIDVNVLGGEVFSLNAVNIALKNSSFDNGTDSTANYYRVNAATEFVLGGKDKTGAYTGAVKTGYAAMPAMDLTGGHAWAWIVPTKALYTDLVFVYWDGKAPASSAVKNDVFVAHKYVSEYTDANGLFYVYNAVVNGEVTTITFKGNAATIDKDAYYTDWKKDATYGYVTNLINGTEVDYTAYYGLKFDVTNGTVTMGITNSTDSSANKDNYKAILPNTEIYVVSSKGAIAKYTLEQYMATATYTDNYLEHVFHREVKDATNAVVVKDIFYVTAGTLGNQPGAGK